MNIFLDNAFRFVNTLEDAKDASNQIQHTNNFRHTERSQRRRGPPRCLRSRGPDVSYTAGEEISRTPEVALLLGNACPSARSKRSRTHAKAHLSLPHNRVWKNRFFPIVKVEMKATI